MEVVVVTAAPASSVAAGSAATTETAAGTAYPRVAYDAEVPLIFKEIDPVQNNAVNASINTTGFTRRCIT